MNVIINILKAVQSYSFYAAFIGIFMGLFACEDEVVDRIVEIPGDTVTVSGLNQINAFLVTEISPDTVLEAAIVEDSIIIYWPAYEPVPEFIQPLIALAEGASISPASGVSVPFTTGTQYTVTAESGGTRSFVLKVIVNQPLPLIENGEGSGDNIRYIVVREGVPDMFIIGDFFVPDANQTQVHLISYEEDTRYQMDIETIRASRIELNTPVNVPKAFYQAEFQTGIHTIILDSVWVKFPQPALDWPPFLQLSRGETFTINGFDIRDIEGVQISTIISFNEDDILESEQQRHPPFEVVSFTSTTLTLRVPDDFPTGMYNPAVANISTPWAQSGFTFGAVAGMEEEFFMVGVFFGMIVI